jgi:hypothetical protein
MRKFALLVAALVALMMMLAVPAGAEAPEQTEEPAFFLFADTDNGLAVFVNITRNNFCAWEAGGFADPPPVDALVPVQAKETGQGAIVASFNTNLSIELWRLDEDVPPLVGPCEDTDGQIEPWATGIANVRGNDNDFDVSLTRTNSFGNTGVAAVVDANGDAWHYSWTMQLQIIRDGEFRALAEQFNLKKKGN